MTVVAITPMMRAALLALRHGHTLEGWGLPTKQRLAKQGLAKYLTPKLWNGPMKIADAGLMVIEADR